MNVGLIYRDADDSSPIVVARVGRLSRPAPLTPHAPGPAVRVRILRECARWRSGQTVTINADYARQLVKNGLAVEVDQKMRRAGKPVA